MQLLGTYKATKIIYTATRNKNLIAQGTHKKYMKNKKHNTKLYIITI